MELYASTPSNAQYATDNQTETSKPTQQDTNMKTTVNPRTAAIASMTSGPSIPIGKQPFYVPLTKLKLAPEQVRQTPPTESGIKEMAALLASQGQLNALHVTKDAASDRYFVHAGGRRLRGFQRLAKEGKIMPDFPVECKEVDEANATALGLTENISQEAMHPADAYEAFKALVEKGIAAEAIATQFGVTVLTVQRRLKLANLAPELLALYRKGELQLDQVMALVQLDDKKRQVLLWKGLGSYNRNANQIRRMIAQDEVSMNDPRVKLVGLATYTAAGGGIRSDLFSEKGNERFLTDPMLLDMLVGEAFEVQAAELRAQGWKWVDIHPEYTYSEQQQYFTLPQKTLPESPVQKDERLKLEADLEALENEHSDCEDDDELDALQDKIDAVEQKLAELAVELVDKSPRDKDLGGVVLTIDAGKIKSIVNLARVSERKQVMAELEARKKRAASLPTGPQGEGAAAPAEDAEASSSDADDAIPERLMLNLSAQRTAAIQACMISNQKVTLAALAQRMATSVFQDYYGGDEAIKISRTNAWHVLEKSSPTVGASRAATVMGDERKRWEALLPQDKKTWLQWFIDQPLEVSLSMIVFGTAETVNALQSKVDSRDCAADLARSLNLDMKAWWEPTAANYLELVPKTKILQAVVEAHGGPLAVAGWEKLKKDELVDRAHDSLKGTGWLPVALR